MTGGAVRIGRAISLALASEGVKVVVHYNRSQEAAESLIGEIDAAGGTAIGIAADLSKSVDDCRLPVDSAIEHFGRADILINSAAIFHADMLADATEEQFDRHIAVNLKAPLFLCQAFANSVTDGQRAHIVNIADWRATRPPTGHLTYTLTKSGIVTMTKILAQELAPHIQVNCICPGAILPPVGVDDDVLDELSKRNPLGRVGGTDAITNSLLYLLRSDFITGEALHVTGGEEL